MFLSEHPPVPFLPKSPHGMTARGRELLFEFSSDDDESLIPDNFYPVEIMVWSDGFLAHQYSVKNDAAAHVAYVTIGAPNGDHSGKNTVPVWLGSQKQSSLEAEAMLVKDINELSSKVFPVYHRLLNKIVNVKVKLYVFLADRPEKCKRLGLLQGQAFAARYGFVGNIKDVFDKMVCCDNCFHLLYNNKANETISCPNCFSFHADSIFYTPNPDYPPDLLTTRNKLPYKRIHLKELPHVMKKVFDNYIIKKPGWSTKKAIYAYLRSEGINNSLQKQLLENADRLRDYDTMDISKYPVTIQATITENFEKENFKYRIPDPPPFWKLSSGQFDVQDAIDAPGHLLSLGASRSLYKNIFSIFLTGQKKMSCLQKNLI
jgi:hypothetical protein